MEITEEQLLEIKELHDRASQEKRKSHEPEYWQGKADATRQILAMLEPDQRIWQGLIDTSNGFRAEEHDVLKNMLKDVYMNLCAILWELKNQRKAHPQTRINLLGWIHSYDRMAIEKRVLEADGACDPF